MMSPMNDFRLAIPVLRVTDLARSLDYYVKVLGFKIDWEHPSRFASVSRECSNIFLCEGDQGHLGTWIWIGVPDVDTLCMELRSRGGIIRHPPTNYEWAFEMQVADSDGNVLRFGTDPKPEAPFGEWLDMEGRAWPSRDGEKSKR